MRILLLAILLAIPCLAEPFIHKTDAYEFQFDGKSGGHLKTHGKTIAINRLWSIAFYRHQNVDSKNFLGDDWKGNVTTEFSQDRSSVDIKYDSQRLGLTITLDFKPEYIDFNAHIRKTTIPILYLYLPAETDFPTDDMSKFLFPYSGQEAHGIAFLPSYFGEHKPPHANYAPASTGQEPYKAFLGDTLAMKNDDEPEAQLQLTELGKTWFSKADADYITSALLKVPRPTKDGHGDLELIRNTSGVALAGFRFGGKGYFFRLGSNGNNSMDKGSELTKRLVVATMNGLQLREPELLKGKKIAVVSLANGPIHGCWTPTKVPEWETLFALARFKHLYNAQFIKLDTPDAMREALKSKDVGMILNPYGEYFPSGDKNKLMSDLALVKDFVRDGGVWWEIGGFSFHYVLEPKPYLYHETINPAGVADWCSAQYADGSVTIFGIRPVMRRPWDAERYTNPSLIAIAGKGNAANFQHAWIMATEPGMTWKSQPLRWKFTYKSPQEALDEYAKLLEIKGSLEAKVTRPGVLDKLKNAVLFKFDDRTAEDQIKAIDTLPKNNIVHYAEYLKGGFDKEYPDHLPCNPRWGSDDDLRKLIDRAHELGHLAVPYTNTSWWCEDPRGPTFLEAGDAPLSRTREGKLKHEKYARNEGYTICFHHPAVIAAHRKVRKQMTEDFKHDLLFQDQVGCRGFTWDYNPYDPLKASCREGMHSLSMEDAQHIPVGCEDANDRVLNFETLICGTVWGTVPVDGQYRFRHLKYKFPEGEWQFFPILSYLGHDQCLFTPHDLGHFIRRPEHLCVAVAFGLTMSDTWNCRDHRSAFKKNWVHWLDAVQKTAAADYAGKKLLDFRYLEEGHNRPFPHELLYTRYADDIVIVSNMGDKPIALKGLVDVTGLPREELNWLDGQTLPGYGFYISSPRVRVARINATNQDAIASIALAYRNGQVSGTVMTSNNATIALPVPETWSNTTAKWVDFAGVEQQVAIQCQKGMLTMTTPKADIADLDMPKAYANTAPKSQAGLSNKVAIYAPKSFPDEPFKAQVSAWQTELKRHIADQGLAITMLETPQAMVEAISRPVGDSQRPFAIIAPYHEHLFLAADMDPFEVLGKIKRFVDTGGIWWATGGQPFHYCRIEEAPGQWKKITIGGSGLATIGATTPITYVDESGVPLEATDAGKAWFGEARSERIASYFGNAQRPFLYPEDKLPLVMAGAVPYIAPIRCEGWGYFFNIGGFNVKIEEAADIVSGTLIHLWNNPWEPNNPAKRVTLWRF
ncbi:MAG: DUF6259 domain-containing protein [Lentisphaeria bacterium]|jgi:hypothetical protein|nr:hypothetical protein [Lentisphaerota bacterium]